MQRNDKTNFRSKLRINTEKIIFLPSTSKILSKESSLDPNNVVIPEKQLFRCGHPNSGKYYLYTALSKLNIQKFAPGLFGAKVLANGKQVFQLSCALKNLSKEMFFYLIRSVLFEKRLSSVFHRMQFLSAATAWRLV